jgi:hypothetical protein
VGPDCAVQRSTERSDALWWRLIWGVESRPRYFPLFATIGAAYTPIVAAAICDSDHIYSRGCLTEMHCYSIEVILE